MGRVLRPSLGVLSVAVDAVDSARAANLAKSETRVGPNVWSGPTCSSTLGFTDSPDTQVAATYGASVIPKIYVWLLLPIAITGGVVITLGLILGGFIWIMALAVNEEICFDRWPWWGPPENPDVYTSCSGHYYERHHK